MLNRSTIIKALKKPHLAYLILAAILLLSSIWTWQHFTSPTYLPINHVKIHGNILHTSQRSLKITTMPALQQGFLALDIHNLRHHMLQLPWIDKVSIRKVWPDTLILQLSEKRAWLRWNEGGVITPQRQVFYPPKASIPKTIPWLNGPKGQTTKMINMYKKINKQLKPLKLRVQRLDLTPRFAWHMKLNTGVNVFLGRTHVTDRVKRFVKVYSRLFENNAHAVSYVDMRYHKGMAVNWKKDM